MAAFFRDARERAGVSQTDVQRLTGVNRAYVSSIEQGRIAVVYPEIFNTLHHVYRFAGWAGLDAMGYQTDAGEADVNPAILSLLRGLSDDQQRAAEGVIRAMLKLSAS